MQCSFSSVASGDEAIITLFGYVDDHHFSVGVYIHSGVHYGHVMVM